MIDARLKSLFVLPSAVLSLALVAVSVVLVLTSGHDSLAWWGAAMAGLPLPVVLARLIWLPVARTSDSLPVALGVAAAGLGLAAWMVAIERVAGWQPLAVASAGAVMLLLYVFWYSRFGRVPNNLLDVGGKLPAFELGDTNGAVVRSADLLGSPAVWLFFRGNWCPLCMAQIREIAGRYRDLAQMGVELLLVSPQPEKHTRELAQRFDAPLRFLVDEGNRVAADLGIAVSHGVPLGIRGGYDPDTVLPTLIVTNAAGTIVFSDLTDSYRVRPEPDTYIAILRRAGAVSP